MTQRRGDLVDLFHAGTHRPATHQDQHVAGPDRMIALPLDRGDGLFLPGEDPRRTGLAVDSSASTTLGSIAVLLMTDPSGARFPRVKVTCSSTPTPWRAPGS